MKKKYIIAADIGGTYCRIALFSLTANDKDKLKLENTAERRTADMKNLGTVLDFCRTFLPIAPEKADIIVLAAAGYSSGQELKTTNADLSLDIKQARDIGIKNILLINDFMAQGLACLEEPGKKSRLLLGPDINSWADLNTKLSANIYKKQGTYLPKYHLAQAYAAVIGAGTGLGAAFVLQDEYGRILINPSEMGQVVFPFTGLEEAEFAAFICKEKGLDYVRYDDVLSGRGLSFLHAFLHGKKISPQEVAVENLQTDTPLLRLFSRFYARACRNLFMTCLCCNGLFISGGIARKNPLIVNSSAFAREFYNASKYRQMLSKTPVRLIENELAGLWGAASLGRSCIHSNI